MNVLMYAFYDGAPDHEQYRDWLEAVVASDEPLGLSEVVLSSFVRIATNPRIFSPAASVAEAFAFVDALRGQPNAVIVAPGARHWSIFERVCRESGPRASLVADAYLAALAIESGSEWITADRDFSRFADLRWRHPLTS